MTRQRSALRRLWSRAALGIAATCSALALLAPTALADPQSDASAAIDAAWSAAGGEQSLLGARDGDVYSAGPGFGQNFAGGAIFFTPETGAHVMYGEILAKYRAVGGPGESDLGFPTIDEGPGRVSPDSRNSLFSGADQPVIFWTPTSGAWVVRGAVNAAWDALGGSSGAMGVPTGDETRDGDVVSQAFSGGKISFNTVTRQFTTEPAELAQQLGNVVIPGAAPPPPPPAAPSPTASPTEVTPTAPGATAEPTPTTAPAPQADDSDGSGFNWWWLLIPLVLLGALLAWLAGRRRRPVTASSRTPTPPLTDSAHFDGLDERPGWAPPSRERDIEPDRWSPDAPPARSYSDSPLFGEPARRPSPFDEPTEPPLESPGFGTGEADGSVGREDSSAASGFELFTHRGAHAATDDPDVVDTAPTPVQPETWEGDTPTGRHAALEDDEPTFDAERYEVEGYDSYPEPPDSPTVTDFAPDAVAPGDFDFARDDFDDDRDEIGYGEPDAVIEAEVVPAAETSDTATADDVEHQSALHLPLADHHLAPEGYPVKGRMSTGTYHTPGSAGYDEVVAEIWFADAEHAEANGFIRGD